MTAELARRAAVHAALGDPTRLRIVDHLLLGDLSPGALVRHLDIASNLLAHHVNVLADAGVVRRTRSEGDRRRSYVQLAWDPVTGALAATGAIGGMLSGGVDRVVFVCTHNSARSHLATAAWKRVSDVPVASAGTRPAAAVNPLAVAAGRRHDLRVNGRRRPAHVDDVVRAGDFVVAVCDNAFEALTVGPAVAATTGGAGSTAPRLHWSVPDPARVGTDQAFDAALEQLLARVDRLGRAVARPIGETA